MSFRNSRRLGITRPSLDSMRTTRQEQQVETNYDDDDYYDEEEEEDEALLSRKHGEAAEASSSKPAKRPPTEQDILDEYKQQDKERKTKVRRKVVVTPEDLMKPKGLTVVRNDIAPRFQQQKFSNNPKSMAKLSRKLVGAYADWMDDMTGGLTLTEMHWKLRVMSSKTQIKQYLEDMRKSVRDDHVERLLGLETAQRLLGQLEDYYREEQQQEYNDGDDDPEPQDHDDEDVPVANPYVTRTATRTTVAVTPTNPKPAEDQEQPQEARQNQQQEEDPLVRRLALQKEHRARKHVLEDSDDDEEEAVFDDVVVASTTKSSGRRHVLDDSDDDDDDENDAEKETTNDPDMERLRVDDEAVKDSGEGLAENSKETDLEESDSEEVSAAKRQLDEKFESVKALLEGGDPTNEEASKEDDAQAIDGNDGDDLPKEEEATTESFAMDGSSD